MKEIEFDDTFTGKRFTYGLTYRPLGYTQVPDGYIVYSERKHHKFKFGTVDYPFQLTPEQIRNYQLVKAVRF